MFNQKQREQVLAISLIVAAISMLTVFLSVCIRKKSLSRALLAVAGMEGAIGLFILWKQQAEERRSSRPRFAFDGPDAELFDTAEADIVEDQVGESLGTTSASDRRPTAAQIYTIPVDEETTIADFVGSN